MLGSRGADLAGATRMLGNSLDYARLLLVRPVQARPTRACLGLAPQGSGKGRNTVALPLATRTVALKKACAFGFSDPEQYSFKSQRGLNRAVVEQISEIKHEPDWM